MVLLTGFDLEDTTLNRHRKPLDVPSFAFYGEASDWTSAALLHSEPLIERSRAHAWRIRPHRHDSLVQLFWLSKGRGRARFDAQRHDLKAPCVAVIPERCVHEFDWERESEGFALSLASALAQELRSSLGLRDDAFRRAEVIQAHTEAAYVDMLFDRIQSEYRSEADLHEAALDSIVRALAVWIARHAPARYGSSAPATRGAIHFTRFSKLLDKHHKEHWHVADFARALGVSAAHLNAICRRHGGDSAKNLVQARLLLAARRELAYTDKSIADVANALGFSDASYFTRYFKRNMSMTPKTYRRRTGTLRG